jgi:DtxR family Mn-dependent transcriptional regulator
MADPVIALSVFAALVVVAAGVFWPRRGIVARARRVAERSERVLLEDALKHIYMCERRGMPCSLESVAGRLEISTGVAAQLLERLGEAGFAQLDTSAPELTDEGRASALRLLRSHRLWERYLADRTGVPAAEWHDEAERMEHALSSEETETLASRLGHPTYDPHGDPIPTASGHLPPAHVLSLVGVEVGRTVEVIHLEDEPREIYDTLLGEGLAPGVRLTVLHRTESGITVRGQGREWTMSPVAARNLTIRYLPAGAAPEELDGRSLADVPMGETVRVLSVSSACQGTQRRRLLDLGVVPGTEIVPELRSASGDPVAYRIRGALIGLRVEQARWIRVADAEPDEVKVGAAQSSDEGLT